MSEIYTPIALDFELGTKALKATVHEFTKADTWYAGVRYYYQKGSELLPGKNGISIPITKTGTPSDLLLVAESLLLLYAHLTDIKIALVPIEESDE